MKHLRRIIGVLLIALIPVLAWVSFVSAQQFSTQLEKGKVVNSSMYSAGKEIDIRGEVFGDVFCAGQKVRIDAIVHGDVLCAGQEVTINGTIDGDIRAAGQNISIGAKVAKNVTVTGVQFSLDAESKVEGDLTAAGQQLNIKGHVGRDAIATGNDVILNGYIGRNAKVETGKLQLKDRALVTGNLVYTSDNKLQRDQKAQVTGKTEQIVPKKESGFNFALYLFAVSSLTLISVIITYLFPRFIRQTSQQIADSPTRALILGILFSFLVPAVMLALSISFIGIPAALVLLLGWIVGIVLSGPISAYYVGKLVLRKSKIDSPVSFALIGGIILVSTYFLPYLGLGFLIVAYWLGFGALLLNLRSYLFEPEKAASKKK